MPHPWTRRECLGLGLALAASAQPRTRYRVALIGHTGRGNYGHNWDLAWNGIDAAEVVAVADPDEKGRAAARKRSHALRSYADYREMLRKEKPDIVTIAPRWADQRVPMMAAAAEIGAHVLMEKPFAQSLPEADRLVELARRGGIRVQVGHAARASASVQRIRRMLAQGEIGELVEMRSRGKEDRRAGGEDLVVLGSHALDLMRFFAGDPKSVMAHVTQNREDVTPAHGHPCKEAVGLVAGDQVTATFVFGNGIHGTFDSKLAGPAPPGNRCGVTLHGSKGAISIDLGTSRSGAGLLLRSPIWEGDKSAAWEPLPPGTPEIEGDRDHASGAMALDLIQAIEQKREPVCSARDGLWTMEMIAGIYRGQFSGGRVVFPLQDRRDPLAE